MKGKNESSALEKHIRYFGGPEGVSYNSMVEQNEKIGLNWWEARKLAATVSAGAGIKITGCPFLLFTPKQGVGLLNHPQSTGIYNLDGSINEDRWNELLSYAEKSDADELIITEPKLYEFLDFCRKKETRPDPLNLAKYASDGEWGTYMELFTETNPKNAIRFVTIEQLRAFFEDSQIPGHQLEERNNKIL